MTRARARAGVLAATFSTLYQRTLSSHAIITPYPSLSLYQSTLSLHPTLTSTLTSIIIITIITNPSMNRHSSRRVHLQHAAQCVSSISIRGGIVIWKQGAICAVGDPPRAFRYIYPLEDPGHNRYPPLKNLVLIDTPIIHTSGGPPWSCHNRYPPLEEPCLN